MKPTVVAICCQRCSGKGLPAVHPPEIRSHSCADSSASETNSLNESAEKRKEGFLIKVR